MELKTKQINLKNKTALVTGAARGIGQAIAIVLQERGANVVFSSRNKPDLKMVYGNEVPDNVARTQCNVANYAEVEAAVSFCKERLGSLDIIVNNAGLIEPITHLSDANPEQWAQVIDVNVKGVFNGMHAALAVMKEQGQGTIINISSGAANSALEGWSHYCASKAAAKKLTEVGDKENAESGVTVVGLSPGTVATDMMAAIRESGINPVSRLDWSKHIPPEWVGEAVVFLCSESGKKYAGQDFSLKTNEGRAEIGLPLIES